MIALALSTFIWTLGFFLEANSNTLERQLLFNNIGYLGSISVPVAWLVFAVNYTNGSRLLYKWRVVPFCIIPIVIVSLVWSNNWHHFMWSNEHLITSGAFIVTAKTYGWFFWISAAHSYILMITGAVILLRRLLVGISLYIGQAVSLMVAISLPLLWNIMYVFNLLPVPRKDLTPVMFAFSGIAITLGLLRFRLFAAIPFARKFVIQQLVDGVFVFDADSRLMEANPSALKMIEKDKSIIGKELKELLNSSPLFERLSSDNSERIEFPLTLSGEELFYELEKLPLRNNQGQRVGWLAIIRDITELKKMQEQLIMQDRLASIGQLTSGVAHEINNPLTSILGFSNILLQRELPDDIKKDLEIINKEAYRTANIVKNLLTFARKHPQEKQPVDINESIKRVLVLRNYEQKVHNIKIETNLDMDLPLILGNSSQLQQVFFNIVINAEFFMRKSHGKGVLTITTERLDNQVHASFKDDGPGISEVNMKHLFKPFYTTKDVGEGTGLGLSICQNIVAEHRGRVWLESKLEKGTTFIVELPVSENSSY